MLVRKHLFFFFPSKLALVLCLALFGQTLADSDGMDPGNKNESDRSKSSQHQTLRRKLKRIESFTGNPDPSHLPLGLCQGDCDDTNQCASGLVCFQRNPYTAVPGCEGGEADSSNTDYCILSGPNPSPTNSPPAMGRVHYLGNNGRPASVFPLPLCGGDCDTSDDCAPGLVCFQRDRFQSVPGCSGGEKDSSLTDYCIDPRGGQPQPSTPTPSFRPTPTPPPQTPRPPSSKMLEFVGNDGSPSSAYPLGECQGECDSSNDCAPGLICFQRDSFQPVPGCLGGEKDYSQSDYCIRPPGAPVPPAPTVTPAPAPRPTPRPPSGTENVKYVGNDGSPSSSYPLGLCQGDCDSDDECDFGLYCFQRDRNDAVPGCQGGESDRSHNDYCVPLPPGQQPPAGTFRLKMYWEEGYFWQEETVERKWCATFDYDGYPGTGKCWYGLDAMDCKSDQVYIARCGNDRRQRFLFENLSDGEVLIELGNGGNQCLERSRRSIYVRDCDSNNSLQRWWAPNGSFTGSRFEISQKGFSQQCVTTAHHPKAGEVVETQSCEASRAPDTQTSYWNKY